MITYGLVVFLTTSSLVCVSVVNELYWLLTVSMKPLRRFSRLSVKANISFTAATLKHTPFHICLISWEEFTGRRYTLTTLAVLLLFGKLGATHSHGNPPLLLLFWERVSNGSELLLSPKLTRISLVCIYSGRRGPTHFGQGWNMNRARHKAAEHTQTLDVQQGRALM